MRQVIKEIPKPINEKGTIFELKYTPISDSELIFVGGLLLEADDDYNLDKKELKIFGHSTHDRIRVCYNTYE